jgi:alpha-glucoside transport system substrate-binding protein
MSYIAAPDFADNRIIAGTGAYLSAHRLQNTGLYRESIDRSMAEILVSADPFRFDGSDLMPAEIGSDVLPRAATIYASGASDAWGLVDEVEAAWPR